MQHKHENFWLFPGRDQVSVGLAFETTLFATINKDFQIFDWTNHLACRKQSKYGCWVLNGKFWYIMRTFNSLFDRKVIGLQYQNRLSYRYPCNELNIRKVLFLQKCFESLPCLLIPVHHLPPYDLGNTRRTHIARCSRPEAIKVELFLVVANFL